MPGIRHQDYKGFAISAMATPAGSGKYHSIFFAHLPEQSENTNDLPVAHQEKITENPTFATEAEAIDAALGRAIAWIDTRVK